MNDYFPKLFGRDEEEDSLYPNMWITTARGNGRSAFLDYCKRDYETTKDLYSQMGKYIHEGIEHGIRFSIKKVIFNDPATIVIWADGSKTIVKCQEGDVFDKEKGLAMAISKRALGDKGNYCEIFKKWIPEIEEAKVETEVLFNDFANLTKHMSETIKRASEAIVSAVHESNYNQLYKCSTCVSFDQDTELKKLFCKTCQCYNHYVEKGEFEE